MDLMPGLSGFALSGRNNHLLVLRPDPGCWPRDSAFASHWLIWFAENGIFSSGRAADGGVGHLV